MFLVILIQGTKLGWQQCWPWFCCCSNEKREKQSHSKNTVNCYLH